MYINMCHGQKHRTMEHKHVFLKQPRFSVKTPAFFIGPNFSRVSVLRKAMQVSFPPIRGIWRAFDFRNLSESIVLGSDHAHVTLARDFLQNNKMCEIKCRF